MKRIMCLAVAGLAVSVGCATVKKEEGRRPEVEVIAHRGASAYAPENTLAAFRAAIEMEADWFELDCTLTRDDAVIVIHDDDTERTTGVKARVQDLTLAELKALDAGSWFDPKYAGEPLPTLGEALELAKGRIGVYIEVKNSDNDDALIGQLVQAASGHTTLTPELQGKLMGLVAKSNTRNLALTRQVIREVRAREMQAQVVIQSFSPVICLTALSEAPEIRTEMLGSEDEKNPEHWPRVVWFSRLIGAKGLNVKHDSLSPERIADFHAHGQTVAVWTLDERADMERLVSWGVDKIITNKPDVARALLTASK